MIIPDPKANTTTEAYLAYKAGFLEESELKPSLYEPYLHFDAWLAYWAGLTGAYPTDENGNPEMLCDEEALVAYLSGVTDTYPEEIKDPYDVRIVGYLKYLVSARWGKPEYPVNNEEFYLSTMKPPVVTNDTPSAEIELDDTAEAPFIDLKMYGDTFQQTSSPNPDYPQNVNVVTGEQTATVTGKNMFDKSTVVNGVLEGSGSIGISNEYKTSDFIMVNPNTTYYKGLSQSARFKYYASDKTPLTNVYNDIDNAGQAQSFTTPANAHWIRLSIANNNVDTLQIEQGSSATAYEPYQSQSYEVNLGKNLNSQGIRNGLYQISNGSYVNGGDYVTTQDLLPIGYGNTITISTQSGLSGNFYILEYDSNKSYLNVNNVKRNVTSATFTISNANTKYIAVDFATTSATATTVGGIQVEAGSSATSYAPYFTPIELCKIGTYQDYIYKSGDDWYVHKEIGKAVLNGVGGAYNSTNNWYYVGVPPETPVLNSSVLSDYFTGTTSSYMVDNPNANGVIAITSNTYVLLRNTDCVDLTSYRTWLSTHNTTIYYALATPTDTQITNTDLINQLDALMEGGSYEGKTYIKVTATDPNLPGLLYVAAEKYD